MNTKTLFCAIAAAAVVVGCATPPGSRTFAGSSMNCPGASCDVIVYVSGDPSVAPPIVAVSADEVRVGGNSPDITWKLQAPGYKFCSDSIAPHTAAPSGGKMTTTQSAWNAQITFQNSSNTTFKVKKVPGTGTLFYDVKVYRDCSGTPLKLDPAIVNDF